MLGSILKDTSHLAFGPRPSARRLRSDRPQLVQRTRFECRAISSDASATCSKSWVCPPDELAQMAVRELETLGVQQERLALRSRSAQPVVGLVTWDLMSFRDCSAPSLASPASHWKAWAINAWRSIAAGSTASGEPICNGPSGITWMGLLLCGVPRRRGPIRTTTCSHRSSR